MRKFALYPCVLVSLLTVAACGDVPTQPDAPADVAVADGPAYNATLQGCVSDGLCTLQPIVVGGGDDPDPGCDVLWKPSCGTCITGTINLPYDTLGVSSCPGGGGGSGGGSGEAGGPGGSGGPGLGDSTPPEADGNQGPGVFVACVGTLLGVMGTAAMLEPLGHDVYNAREEYASAKRMYDAVMANDPTLQMELLYAHRVEVARANYNDAVQNYSLGAGASVLAVIAAVVACSPGVILPTP
ncbi:hypothetical protein [Longimicrobium sp.]|uniref:hypothetical protein n=1 Tax=Longimicrobium sp. TaxID=2029185 RepID=UPI003B3B90EF